IDFEDGFGHRPETEEKEHAVRAARELATALRQGIAPRRVGIRPRPISHDGRFQRTLGTFLRELATVGRVPEGFAVTVPKPLSADDVETAAYALMRLEDELSLEAGRLHLELMLETPEALMDDEGRCPLPRWVAAGMGRVRAVHLGPYDLTASLGVIGSDQDVDHPACDQARATAAIALSRKGIWLADGPTTRLPIGPHRGDELTEAQEAENRAVVHDAWARHARNVRSALRQGYVQGWDLHPGQLPARFGALAAVFVAELPAMAARLRRYVEAAAQATRTGADFDDAATARGLVRWFRRGLDSGLLTPEDLGRAGLGGTDLVPSGG
ncbi:MAG: phosphoenolpyruvate kinase, partial [Myxococcales bacterium]|nr:phosphoenolpyruvate kinase [Myxococcales bacterium]